MLTSSEPSRQLSCPSHRRLADTQPPLAHTYSLTEHVGRTEQALVNNVPDLCRCQTIEPFGADSLGEPVPKHARLCCGDLLTPFLQCEEHSKNLFMCTLKAGFPGILLACHLFLGSSSHLPPSCSLPGRRRATSARCRGY